MANVQCRFSCWCCWHSLLLLLSPWVFAISQQFSWKWCVKSKGSTQTCLGLFLHSIPKSWNKQTFRPKTAQSQMYGIAAGLSFAVVKMRYLNKTQTTIIWFNNKDICTTNLITMCVCLCVRVILYLLYFMFWPLLHTWFTMCQWLRVFFPFFSIDQTRNIKNPFERTNTACCLDENL